MGLSPCSQPSLSWRGQASSHTDLQVGPHPLSERSLGGIPGEIPGLEPVPEVGGSRQGRVPGTSRCVPPIPISCLQHPTTSLEAGPGQGRAKGRPLQADIHVWGWGGCRSCPKPACQQRRIAGRPPTPAPQAGTAAVAMANGEGPPCSPYIPNSSGKPWAQ